MNDRQVVLSIDKPTLALRGIRSILFQTLLVSAAVGLPALAHLTGAPVRILLPMHWAVILAGLVFGWRGGALVGLLSPLLSNLISGMPFPGILPAMTIELALYGFVAGFLRERFRLNAFICVIAAILAGRAAFILAVLAILSPVSQLDGYFTAALIPGIPAAVAQIILLPLLARWWVNAARSEK
jgi:uncharacterized membrane protein